jgi:hypothetical protein
MASILSIVKKMKDFLPKILLRRSSYLVLSIFYFIRFIITSLKTLYLSFAIIYFSYLKPKVLFQKDFKSFSFLQTNLKFTKQITFFHKGCKSNALKNRCSLFQNNWLNLHIFRAQKPHFLRFNLFSTAFVCKNQSRYNLNSYLLFFTNISSNEFYFSFVFSWSSDKSVISIFWTTFVFLFYLETWLFRFYNSYIS